MLTPVSFPTRVREGGPLGGFGDHVFGNTFPRGPLRCIHFQRGSPLPKEPALALLNLCVIYLFPISLIYTLIYFLPSSSFGYNLILVVGFSDD